MKVRTGYLIKRNRTYYACWTVNGKKFMRTTGQSNERKARAKMQDILEPFLLQDKMSTLKRVAAQIGDTQSAMELLEDKSHPAVTLADAWDVYMASPKRPDSGPATLAHYEGQMGQFAKWMKTAHPDVKNLRSVNVDIANAYAEHLVSRKLSANRFNKHIRLLDLLFRVLKQKARLKDNPWAEIQRKRQNSVSRRELTVEELRKVCMSAKGELRLLFGIGIYSGLRLGDCATLRWSEIDLVRNVIRRIPNKTARRNPKPVLVPIHPVLRGLLTEPELQGHHTEFVLPETAALYERDSGGLSKRIQTLFTDNGIKTHGSKQAGRRNVVVEVGFHSLRHTFVSLCREANAPLAVVEAIVGHANPAMTRHYTHVSEQAASLAVAALPSVMTDKPDALATPKKPVDVAALVPLVESLTSRNVRKVKAALLAQLTAA